ncbi:transforming growth factor-beta receptor-associated protein 1-like [Centruroides sculpturatus]|uniref:transforming growth factor-beta receptor-associated protein 1-like n=1 Tax=Centruroides sculpturatus TaxID=218467 RepID=UPI000C6D463C|nr:transforming growth factor-beta receptor-associated protein 1-like [Centruroides sculpturatus]
MSVKAFDLVPAIERVSLGDKVKTSIECLECCGKDIYVGTSESFIIHYHLEDKSQPDGTYRFQSKKLMQKYLGYKKPVLQLKAVSALNRIFALCDGNFMVLNMVDLETIPSMSKLKGITSFCLNENPTENNPFSVEVCLARKKQIQLYHITDDKIIHIKDVNLPDLTVTMEMDGNFACVALLTKYIVVNMETCYIQDLLPYETGNFNPIVKRITKKEFLIGSPSALGVFVTTEGTSERPPIRWDAEIVAVAYAHPYLLVLSNEFLTVFSIVNHEQKQRVAFRGGICMDNFDGKLYVSSADIICALIPVPWEKQVQALIADKKVSEALELAEYANKSGLSKEQCKQVMQRIRQQAGFIEFSLFHFSKAKEYFQLGCLDVRELISLYPDLLPSSSSSFVRSVPPLHEIANIEQMCSSNPSMIDQCKEFLLFYLEELRLSQSAVNYKFEIDTAILKLYAATNSPNLLNLVGNSQIVCDNKECIQYLTQCEKYHALAIFHHNLKENDKSLQIWARLILGEIYDEDFPGLEYFVEFLSKLSDYHLVWKYVDFVLEKNEELGVKIFTNRPENELPSERMRPELIVDYFHRFPVALIKYLEYLVFVKKLEKEKFHTHLAILYLENVLKLIKSGEESSNLENER